LKSRASRKVLHRIVIVNRITITIQVGT
jgi:hypothetical protein